MRCAVHTAWQTGKALQNHNQTLHRKALKSALSAAMRIELLRGVGHGGALVSSATNGAGSLVYNHYGH